MYFLKFVLKTVLSLKYLIFIWRHLVRRRESYEMKLDPESYTIRHKPVDSVRFFISKILPQLGWGRSDEKEIILDVGCGPGGNTVQLLVPLFPKIDKIFAVDLLPEMIDFAKKRNAHTLIEYSVANIENWSSVKLWGNKITKLSSFYAAILEIEKNSKWSSLFETVDDYVPDSHHDNYHAPYYEEMLKQIGFDIIYCKEEVKTDVFTSDEEYREFFPSICALTSHVPAERKEEFKDDLFQALLEQNGRNSEGLPQHWGNMLELVVRKNE
ncbi:jhamt [Trichonephila clavata]|uniref:Jhamt n=1 Tax=Trichonephila clavata TaxID=2740835 RepID=A0A8X6JBV0_TRICU|nr:jhamt [Trichonephila clavata]